MSNLPPLADAMYRVWWQLARDTADEGFETGKFTLGIPQASEVASIANRDVYGGAGGYNPIGFSQLFSRARQISRASLNLTSADDTAILDDSMVALAPWARSQQDRNTQPAYDIRAYATYTTPEGIQESGWFTMTETSRLPSMVGDFRSLVNVRVQSQLRNLTEKDTPREGTLLSIDRVEVLEI